MLRTGYDDALVETSKEAVAITLLLVRKEREVRHSNNARIFDARKGIERLTRKHYIHEMKGARKQLQEAKAEFQSVYNELEEQDEGKMRVRSKQVTPAANRKVASSELVGNPR